MNIKKQLSKFDTKLRRLRWYSPFWCFVATPFLVVKHVNARRKYINSGAPNKLKSLRNTQTDKRCFIIGNGPSLTTSDLELLQGEVCFAANSIYQIFDKTSWRPNYYLCVDGNFAHDAERIKGLGRCTKFLHASTIRISDAELSEYNVVPIINEPKFFRTLNSIVNYKYHTNIPKEFPFTITVTVNSALLAMSMGFSEIYLLGVDFSYKTAIDRNGNIVVDNAIKSHFEGVDTQRGDIAVFPVDATRACYEELKRFSEDNNVKIVNCTRGGKLEVFQREDLENVLSERNTAWTE